jgi:hypothetical protein
MEDNLIAFIAEIAPTVPYLTFRYNDYDDRIPGDNLYTANFQIARNNVKNYCERYNGVVTAIAAGTNISTTSSWEIMRDYSHLSHNLQFMQYAPELDLFKISIYGNSKPAYQNTPITFNVSNLLSEYTGVNDLADQPAFSIYPNPVKDVMTINGLEKTEMPVKISIHDTTGKEILSEVKTGGVSSCHFNVASLPYGMYLVRMQCGDAVSSNILIKQ